MRTKIILAVIVVLLAVGGVTFWYARASAQNHSPFRTEEVKKEDLLASFSATGTLEPEDIIDVGAQVAGQIKEFGVDSRTGKPIDYASEVEAGAVLAKIDDSLYSAKKNQSAAMVDVAKSAADQAVAKVDDANANVKVAAANLQAARTNLDHTKRDWDRAQNLSTSQAIASADYDTALAAFETARATLAQTEAAKTQADVQVKEYAAAAKNAQANVTAAEAMLKQDEINLGYTVIKAPVKGVVIDRRVTIGQTVQSSFNTPSLFLLARDLKRMKVWASVNEADIGHVHSGQTVWFTVDAYPGEKFQGTVGLVRLNATMTNNVVTYTVEVLTDNPTDSIHPNGKLLPYMTANLKFEVDNRKGALTVSNESLRWKPDAKQVAPEARAAFQKSMQKREAAADGAGKDQGAEANTSAVTRGIVWVQEGQFVKPVKVKLGLTDGNRTEILGGELQEGSAVVTGDALSVGGDDGSNPFAPQMFGGKKQQ
jgi:HlyD family secretion protein